MRSHNFSEAADETFAACGLNRQPHTKTGGRAKLVPPVELILFYEQTLLCSVF